MQDQRGRIAAPERTAVKLSYQLHSYGKSFREAADLVVAFENVGLDIAWTSESYSLDAITAIGYLAARTTRVQLGTSILPIYSRTPTLLAQTAAGLDWVSDGRAILGLGSSGPQVVEGWHGVRYERPLQRSREIVEICRRVWRREVLDFHGSAYDVPLPAEQGSGLGKPLKMIAHPVRSQIPIYLAALGPKNVQLTAEIADGWIPMLVMPEHMHKVWGRALADGTARRSADLGPLEIVAGGIIAIGDDVEPLRELERPHLALYIGGMGARDANYYNDLAVHYGFEREAKVVQDLYLDGNKEAAAAAIPDELLKGTTLIGPDGYIRERLAAYREAGVTILNVSPVGPDPVGTIEKLRALADS
jgi:F420-dependent oxidoreductase-like protein